MKRATSRPAFSKGVFFLSCGPWLALGVVRAEQAAGRHGHVVACEARMGLGAEDSNFERALDRVLEAAET